jgi:hypothetical protein
MLRLMARENRKEWGASIWRYVEAIQAALDAAKAGDITLPEIPAHTPGPQIKQLSQGSGSVEPGPRPRGPRRQPAEAGPRRRMLGKAPGTASGA